jgi:ribosomal-protein-alanine N-acetyltransferase
MGDAVQQSEIRTARLSLVVMSPELLRAEQTSYAELGVLLGAEIAPEWPPENWEPHVFGFIERHYADDATTIGWNRYVVLLREGRSSILIGTTGAFRKGAQEAETGYSIVPSFQRQGYASEATAALMDWLASKCGLRVITAQTYPTLTGSLRVMERCGMKPAGVGDEPGTVRYRWERAETAPA